MNDKDKIYLAALLHDIGKFIERAKDDNWQNEAKKYVINKEASKGYAHRRYSSLFIEKYLSKKENFKEIANTVSELVLHHHNDNKNEVDNYLSVDDRGVLQKIVRIADDLASSERTTDKSLEPLTYYLANLESPFNDITITAESGENLYVPNKKYLSLSKLSLDKECQFPKEKSSENKNKYTEIGIVGEFLNEVSNIETEDALLYLMEKYLINVPAQSPKEFNNEKHFYKADINLYDHSRAVAAIAVVLFEEYLNGSYKGKEKDICSKDYKEQLSNISNPAILLCGNVNGIQDFIFNVKSKRAAKSLKGRSYFVQLLTEVVAKYIIEQWGLKEANILYNGGGNFFILAPNYRKNDLEEIQKFVASKFINTKLYLSIGLTEVTFEDFANFGSAFDRAVKDSNRAKKNKYKNIEIGKVFTPFEQILKGEKKYDKLAESLQIATNYFIGQKSEAYKNIAEWEEVFTDFGYQVSLRESVEIEKQGIVFNTTDFQKSYNGFKFSVKDLTKWTKDAVEIFDKAYKKNNEKFQFETEDGESYNSIINFKRLAELAKFDTGTEKLGVLKMDIDNLGKIFQSGLQKPTIGRVASLSRTLKWFFEGYMNTLLQSDKFKDRIYPIFSGGDDLFVVGSWNKIFDFAINVRKEFNDFVCNHPGITLSTSLLVIDESYPIKQLARIAEERLENAKHYSDPKTNEVIKNAVSVFDTVLSWDDFYKAAELKDKIKNIVNKTENRAVINKIMKSSFGFAAIQKEVLFNKVIKLYKVWRLNYYLRDLANVSNKNQYKKEIESIIDEIIKTYEKLYFEAFKGNKTSIQIFPVAARWAELETRKKIGDK